MSWRIVNVLALVGRFTYRPLIGKQECVAPRRHTKSVSAGVCDRGAMSIIGPLFQDERLELERLFMEIDQFSETFKDAPPRQYNR